MITPMEFESRYHNLDVVLDDGALINVDVNHYRLRGSAPSKHFDTIAAEASKDRLLSRLAPDIKADLKAEADERKAAAKGGPLAKAHSDAAIGHLVSAGWWTASKPWIARVYMGKGWPADIAMTLRLVAKYKLYDSHLDVTIGVKKYCDNYIGLDCNGFVGNYARALGSLSLTPNTYIGSFAPEAKRRTRLEDVRPNDVMVFTDFGHINVIHSTYPIEAAPGGKPSIDCRVVESTASAMLGNFRPGLQNSFYTIVSVNPATKKFTVERPKGGPHSQVYIAPLF